MIYFAKNSGQKPGTASLEYPLFHGSLPPYGYQAVTNVDFAGLNDYFYSPTGWETFNESVPTNPKMRLLNGYASSSQPR